MSYDHVMLITVIDDSLLTLVFLLHSSVVVFSVLEK